MGPHSTETEITDRNSSTTADNENCCNSNPKHDTDKLNGQGAGVFGRASPNDKCQKEVGNVGNTTSPTAVENRARLFREWVRANVKSLAEMSPKEKEHLKDQFIDAVDGLNENQRLDFALSLISLGANEAEQKGVNLESVHVPLSRTA